MSIKQEKKEQKKKRRKTEMKTKNKTFLEFPIILASLKKFYQFLYITLFLSFHHEIHFNMTFQYLSLVSCKSARVNERYLWKASRARNDKIERPLKDRNLRIDIKKSQKPIDMCKGEDRANIRRWSTGGRMELTVRKSWRPEPEMKLIVIHYPDIKWKKRLDRRSLVNVRRMQLTRWFF